MECTFQGPPTASRHGCAPCTAVESEGASRSFPVLLLLRHHLPSARRGKEVQEMELDVMFGGPGDVLSDTCFKSAANPKPNILTEPSKSANDG